MKKEGISLIVLVITIIVMFILVGAVVMTLENTGLIGQSTNTVNKTTLRQVQEIAKLGWVDGNYATNPTVESLTESVNKALRDANIDPEDYNIIVTLDRVDVTSKDGSIDNDMANDNVTDDTNNDNANNDNTNDDNVTEDDEPIITSDWAVERTYNTSGLITKATLTNGTVSYEIGTPVNYMPDGVGTDSYTGGWKLLGVDDEGRLLLVSSNNVNSTKVSLSGVTGFTQAIDTLNDSVASYLDGTIGIAVRSINAEDIEAVTGYNGDPFTGEDYFEFQRDKFIFGGQDITDDELLTELELTSKEQLNLLENNLAITFSWDGTEMPKYSYIRNGITEEGNLTVSHKSGFRYYDSSTNTFKIVSYSTTSKTITTVTNNAYGYYGARKFASTAKAYKMLFKNASGNNISYWVASRYWDAYPFCVYYGVRFVVDDEFGGGDLVTSNLMTYTHTLATRAVVTLAPNITLKNSTTTSGTYDIVQ